MIHLDVKDSLLPPGRLMQLRMTLLRQLDVNLLLNYTMTSQLYQNIKMSFASKLLCG